MGFREKCDSNRQKKTKLFPPLFLQKTIDWDSKNKSNHDPKILGRSERLDAIDAGTARNYGLSPEEITNPEKT